MATTANSTKHSRATSSACAAPGRDGSAWLSTLRTDAMAAFASAGFPSCATRTGSTQRAAGPAERLEPVSGPGKCRRAPVSRFASRARAAWAPHRPCSCSSTAASTPPLARVAAARGCALASLRDRLQSDPSRASNPGSASTCRRPAHAFGALNQAFLDDGSVGRRSPTARSSKSRSTSCTSRAQRRSPFVSPPRARDRAGGEPRAGGRSNYVACAGRAPYLTNYGERDLALGRPPPSATFACRMSRKPASTLARISGGAGAGSSFRVACVRFGPALTHEIA